MGATLSTEAATGQEIRPFTIDVREEQVSDLRRRSEATVWPDRETDPTQGVQLDTIQALARYWATEYDWRRFEQRFSSARMARDYIEIYSMLREQSVARAGSQVVPLLARSRPKSSQTSASA